MTVLSPSFPPVISRTMRIESLPGSAARAVRSTKPGTAALVAIREERFRKSRRLSMAAPLIRPMGPIGPMGPMGLIQLVLRQRQQHEQRVPATLGEPFRLRVGIADVGDQLRP